MKRLLRVVLVVCLCGAMCSGCSWLKFWGDDEAPLTLEEESLDFGDGTGALPGDYELDERFPIDQRRTEPAYQVDAVYFAYDSFQVRSAELSKVERVAEMMRSDAGLTLVTEGHCDERGSNEYNMSLGEHRALAIRANLVTLGVDGSRIQTRSYGEEQPADPGHGDAAWRMNRRVEFIFY
jgi:peptidoglycan-associated lipoprotein